MHFIIKEKSHIYLSYTYRQKSNVETLHLFLLYWKRVVRILLTGIWNDYTKYLFKQYSLIFIHFRTLILFTVGIIFFKVFTSFLGLIMYAHYTDCDRSNIIYICALVTERQNRRGKAKDFNHAKSGIPNQRNM